MFTKSCDKKSCLKRHSTPNLIRVSEFGLHLIYEHPEPGVKKYHGGQTLIYFRFVVITNSSLPPIPFVKYTIGYLFRWSGSTSQLFDEMILPFLPA